MATATAGKGSLDASKLDLWWPRMELPSSSTGPPYKLSPPLKSFPPFLLFLIPPLSQDSLLHEAFSDGRSLH